MTRPSKRKTRVTRQITESLQNNQGYLMDVMNQVMNWVTEKYWGAAKRYAHKNCDYSWSSFVKL